MLISEFDYDLPEELIAQHPADRREGSRLLSVDREKGAYRDLRFTDLPGILRDGDVLVINNTKVFPARLFGRSDTGAAIELFLVEELANGTWEALARPVRRLRPGKRVICGDELSATVLEIKKDGRVAVVFEFDGDFEELLESAGRTPLPPYIRRGPEISEQDKRRYQTVYAKERGAIAAPTAGLHCTDLILEEIRSRGVDIVEITLHVGYGTFEPVRVEDVSEHTVHAERYEIRKAEAMLLNEARGSGRRIVAVGTTSTRALEDCFGTGGRFESGKREARLTVRPGYRFEAVDAMLTNFHLPRSSLLIMVSTFGGYELIMNAYRHAVEQKYRFYSYGDCMFIE